MSRISYFLKEAFINFKRNWGTSLGAIITIFLSLLVIGVFLIAGLMVDRIVSSIEDKVSIQVYVADETAQEDIDALEAYISGLSDVQSLSFTTKEQALINFTESMSSNPEIIEQLDGVNPLPASIDVQLSDTQQVESVASQIMGNEIFLRICDNPTDPADSLKYGQKTVERLFQVTNYIRYAGIALVALLIFVTFIFINNTIRLAILARRKEIGIMRLVGASNGFIRGPFLMESVLQSLLASLLAIISLMFIRQFAMPKLVEALSWLPVSLGDTAYLQVYGILIVSGLLIGLLGSLLAMRRHLKV